MEDTLSLRRMIGQANAGNQQFLQIATTTTITVDFWALTAVGGNAVIAAITNQDNTSALGYFSNATAYQNVFYSGRFKTIKLTSGVVKLEIRGQS